MLGSLMGTALPIQLWTIRYGLGVPLAVSTQMSDLASFL